MEFNPSWKEFVLVASIVSVPLQDLAATVVTCVEKYPVRNADADVLVKRAAVAAAAAAEAAAGRPARAASPIRTVRDASTLATESHALQVPDALETATESPQTGTRKNGPRRCS